MATDINSVDSETGAAFSPPSRRAPLAHRVIAIRAIVSRDTRSSVRNYRRLVANILIPTVVLVAVSGGSDGFRRALTEPYGTYVDFSSYLLPGLVGLVMLLAGSQAAALLGNGRGTASLSFFYSAPLPRWLVIFAKLLAVALMAVIQASVFLLAARLTGVDVDFVAWIAAIPAVMIGAFMITGAIISIASLLPAAGRWSVLILYLVIPTFFLSTSLYPIWRFTDGGTDYLSIIVTGNPFTHAVELIRYASEGQLAVVSMTVILAIGALAFVLALFGINPRRSPGKWWQSGWGPGHGR